MGNALPAGEVSEQALQDSALGDVEVLQFRESDLDQDLWLQCTYAHALATGLIRRNDDFLR
jgi:hypothetical protein